MINVVILYVGNTPKGLWTEKDVVSYGGNVWWDYIVPISISSEDYQLLGLQGIVKKYF